MSKENTLKAPATASAQEKYFLETLPLIRRLVGQKLNAYYRDAAEDISQKVILKLWKWKTRHPEREISEEEWRKLANTAAQNEIKTFYRHKSHRERQLPETTENGSRHAAEDALAAPDSPAELAGNTRAELRSLLVYVWNLLAAQSLREKQALLLKSDELIIYLISYRCCGIRELAAALELKEEEFVALLPRLPLGNEEIGRLLESKLTSKVAPAQVIKARHRARAKLKRMLAVAARVTKQINDTENRDDRTSIAGENQAAARLPAKRRRAG